MELADPEDAAALVADAAATTALEVRHAVGVEGHLPAPGATVVRPGRRQPWQVVAVTVDTLRLRDLAGDVVKVARRSVRPDRWTPRSACSPNPSAVTVRSSKPATGSIKCRRGRSSRRVAVRQRTPSSRRRAA